MRGNLTKMQQREKKKRKQKGETAVTTHCIWIEEVGGKERRGQEQMNNQNTV